MKKEIIDLFIEKTKKTFFVLFRKEIREGSPYIISGTGNDNWDISGFVGAAGSCQGLVAIRLTQSTGEDLMDLIKMDFPDLTGRWVILNDMIGELANTVAGNVLSEAGGDKFRLSVPITVQGKNHIISWPKKAEILAIPFSSDIGSFELQISLVINGAPVSLDSL